MWMLRQDLRAIHEYEADAAVLSQGINMRQYQYLLIQKAVATWNYARGLLKLGKSEQLLKEISLSTRSEKTLKEFYRDFDATFLQAICPDFVDRFNALLREDARFSPKAGSLNTELRIFALIRLGVDDSREIADILHYSHSTIYNYKVSVKNAALGDRDRFEEQVKMIGK